MEEKLISFKTAKLAKEKGFGKWLGDIKKTWYCHAKYFHKKPSGYNIDWKENEPLYISGYDNWIIDYLDNTIFTYVPTQSLIQKWLREVHNIFVYVDSTCRPHIRDKDEKLLAEVKINNKYAGFKYEEALEYGLQEALKLIKNE